MLNSLRFEGGYVTRAVELSFEYLVWPFEFNSGVDKTRISHFNCFLETYDQSVRIPIYKI